LDSKAANFAHSVTYWQQSVAGTATTERASQANPKPLTLGRHIVIGQKSTSSKETIHTQPLIRYEVGDLLRLTSSAGCPCGRPFAYAYIDGQWVECIADAFLQVHGRSEHEWNLILEEWREHLRQHHLKRVTLNGKLLAEFLRELEKDEAWQLQRLRDLEEQPQREVLLMLGSRPVEAIQEPEQAPIEVDLSTLPTYEVYH
jgi:hypothetical protein